MNDVVVSFLSVCSTQQCQKTTELREHVVEKFLLTKMLSMCGKLSTYKILMRETPNKFILLVVRCSGATFKGIKSKFPPLNSQRHSVMS